MPDNCPDPAAAIAALFDYLAPAVPGGWMQRRPGAIGGATGVPIPTLNGVWAYGADAEPSQVLDLLGSVSTTGLPHCLQISPACGDAVRDIPRQSRMHPHPEIPLMTLEITPTLAQPDPADLTIDVLDPADAAVHAEVAAAGFEGPVELFLQLMPPSVLNLPNVRTYLGTVDGQPVTTGVGVLLGNFIAILNIATLPTHRRRGYGAAITARAINDGADRGAQWACLQSSPSGHGVYEKLGFRTAELWECWLAD